MPSEEPFDSIYAQCVDAIVTENEHELILGSSKYILVCKKLNEAVYKADATWAIDWYSDGIRFSDEYPESLESLDPNDSASLDFATPLASLMRELRAYRFSLVEGKPRSNLEATWELTKVLAPQWAGFSPERCSPNQPFATAVRAEIDKRAKAFVKEMEFLNVRFEKQKNQVHVCCEPSRSTE